MKKSLPFLAVIIAISSLVISLIIVIDNDNTSYFVWLFLLPISFAIQSLIFNQVYRYLSKNLVVMIVLCVYFIRNVIAPLVLWLSNYYSMITVQSRSSVTYAVFLMIFETTCVFILLYFECKKKSTYIVREEKNIIRGKSNNIIFMIVFSGIMLFMIVSWIIVPEIEQNYVTIFEDGFNSFSSIAINEGVARNNVDRILLTLFLVLFKIIRIIFPAIILKFIRDKIHIKDLNLILSYLIILSQFLMISSNTMDSFISMVVLFVLLLKLYPQNKGKIFITGGAGVLVVLVFLIIGKGSLISENNNLSAFFQAYFPGVCNLAAMVNIPEGLDKTASLISDIYTTIPFRNSIFKYEGSLNTVEIFNTFNGVRGQIIPFIGEAYYYISFFAPIVPIIIIKVAFSYNRKAQNTDNLYEYITYVYIAIYFACSTVLYHITILGSFILSTMIPMLIIIVFARKKNSNLIISDYKNF